MSTRLAGEEKASLSVRLPKRLKSQAVNIAKAQQVSVSTFVTDLLEKAVRETGQKSVPDAPHRNGKAVPNEDWRTLNDRRIDLIFKERDHGLTNAEQAELELLQEEASRHINQILPLPFDALAEAEEAVKRATRHG